MASASHIPKQNAQAHPNPADSDTIREYDNLFRIFYNYPPALDAVNIAEAYLQCKSLLTLADMYDALGVVGPRIDHHLLQFQSRLWKQIAKYPPSYLKLGYLARSKVIFAEALVHVVGQWPSGSSQLRHTVPDTVRDLIEDKVDELTDRRLRAEMKLFKLPLTTSRTGERITPVSNYIDWLALSLFRQWVAENTSPSPPLPLSSATAPRASSRDANGNNNTTLRSRDTAATKPTPPTMNSGTFYRLLATAGSSYLNHDECKRFIRSTASSLDGSGGGSSSTSSGSSSSREALKRLERRMDEIKNLARETVRPLLKNYLELDLAKDVSNGGGNNSGSGSGGTGGGGLGYLTCTRVEEEYFPWEE